MTTPEQKILAIRLGFADFRLECPKGHPVDTFNLTVNFDGSGTERTYAIIRCPRCPTYRGEYRLAPFIERLIEAGHHTYRLPS